ncbi:MAG: proline--tRNA ligase, partial [Alphaproteobacteria bacterium]|nr:proline--tRNA ligase [Alphaproteobacteria bacterium]
AELWRRSGRYDDYGKEMLRIQDRHGREMLYGPTNEELITEIVAQTAPTLRDLPKLMYHIQWKFRDEVRPRFGVMRGREFYMKDAYSFDVDDEAGQLSYNKMFVSYLRLFARLGLRAIPMRAETGPIGGQSSHEFIILAKTGESLVYCDQRVFDLAPSPQVGAEDAPSAWQDIVNSWTSFYAATSDEHDPARFTRDVPSEHQLEQRGIEVGHIFHFGKKYSESLDCAVTLADGSRQHLSMGSYGVGVSRLAGAMIEASHDDKGIKWHPSVAPFAVGITTVGKKEERNNVTGLSVEEAATALAEKIACAGLSALVDDRNERAGVKFADMDLIGLPVQVVVGKSYLQDGTVEWRVRGENSRQVVSMEAVVEALVTTLKEWN